MGQSRQALADAEARRKRALALHLGGASYGQIAEALGYASRSGAHSAVRDALAERDTAQSAQEALQVELARLDVVIGALTPAVRAGDVQAIDRYLRTIERRTQLATVVADSAAVGEQKEVRTPLDELQRRRASRGAGAARSRGAEVAEHGR